jgi:hypothetical protein
MKNYWLLAGLLALGSPVLAQQNGGSPAVVEKEDFEKKLSKIEFAQNEHNFGEIAEEAGPVQHTFVFKNTGEVPVTILEAKASCGCTTPNWSKEAIAPGQSGEIVAEYNPFNRPGDFHKTITVNTNAEPNTIILNISGTVKPKPRTLADDFPTQLGAMRLKSSTLNFGNITTEKPITKVFDIYNSGDKTLKFDKKKFQSPSYITVSVEPENLSKESKGKLIVTYDVSARNDLGWLTDNVVLFTNEDGEAGTKNLYVSATVEEFFAPMTEEELAKAPRLVLNNKLHEFGSVNEGNTVETQFTLTNSGQQELQIRKTKGNCGCTVGTPEKMNLQPGESTTLKVSFNTNGRQGNQYKEVSIFTNDPRAPIQKVVLKGKVN